MEEDCHCKQWEKGTGNKGQNTTNNSNKANIASTSDKDVPNDNASAALASIRAEFPGSHINSDQDGFLHVYLAADNMFLSHSSAETAFLAKSSKDETFIDSGCFRHLSPCHEWFQDHSFVSLDKPILIHLGDASIIKAEGAGNLQYLMDVPNGVVPGIIPDILYIPALGDTW